MRMFQKSGPVMIVIYFILALVIGFTSLETEPLAPAPIVKAAAGMVWETADPKPELKAKPAGDPCYPGAACHILNYAESTTYAICVYEDGNGIQYPGQWHVKINGPESIEIICKPGNN